MSTTARNPVNSFLSRLLATQGETVPRERYQDPRIQQSKNGSWFIRPWVDVVTSDGLKRRKKQIVLGPASIGKREAVARKTRVMGSINRADFVIASQVPFGEFLDRYETSFVRSPENLASATRAKYTIQIKNHIRPAFGALMMGEITTRRVDDWLAQKAADGLSWWTRTDLRNIMSGIFTKAADWGLWKEANPIERVNVGRKRLVREKRKLTDEQTRSLLAALPGDVRMIVEIALFCTLRISEILGLQWKHIDFERGRILVRQRLHRGDLDVPKNASSMRDVEMGFLGDRLAMFPRGADTDYVFNVQTVRGVCRDDRGLNQHFLRKAAKKLGIYYQGFGFHAFRREAITSIAAEAGINQAMLAAGHTSMDTSLLYTLRDQPAMSRAVRIHQERILGKPEGTVQ